MFNVAFSWFLLLGIVPQLTDVVGNLNGYEFVSSNKEMAYSATIGLDARMFDDRLRLWTDVETYVYKSPATAFGFSPFRSDYRAGFDFFFSKNISFGGFHECDHPVIYGPPDDMMYVKMETQFYFKISGGDR